MDLLTLILVVLVLAWLLGGFALPAAGGLINILLVVVLIVVILKIARSA